MSDETVHNLLTGTEGFSATLDSNWDGFVLYTYGDVKFGAAYALSFDCESTAENYALARFNYISTDGSYKALSDTPLYTVASGHNCATLVIPAFDRPSDFDRAYLMVQAGNLSDVGATIVVTRPMLVEGAEPAAWAPAEGETLAGGCSHER